MHSIFARGSRTAIAVALAGLAFAGTAVAASNQYVVHNIVSSNALLLPADRYDTLNLINPWGLVGGPQRRPGGPRTTGRTR